MTEEEKQEILMKASENFWKAKKIEKSINWNNDADRDSKLSKMDRVLFDMLWNAVAGQYQQKGV